MKTTIKNDELDAFFGAGRYVIVDDAQSMSAKNGEKLTAAIKAEQVGDACVFWFSDDMVKNSTVKFNGHDF